MFKGPAALTGASEISSSGTITTSNNISTSGSGTITSAGALTVSSGGATITGNSSFQGSSTLSVGGLITASAGIQIGGAQLTTVNIGTGGGDAAIVASKSYVDQQIGNVGGGDTVLADVTTMGTPGVYTSVNIDSNNVINFANTADTTAGAITATLALGSASNGKKLFVSWAAKNAAHTSLKVDFGANKIYDAAGTEARYLTFANVGASILMFYSSNGTGHWIISGSGATPSTS